MNSKRIEWVAGNGAAIGVEVYRALDEALVSATVNGRREAASQVTLLVPPISKDGQTLVARIGKVALTEERLAAIRAAQAALQAEIDTCPETVARKLARQLARQRLALTDALAALRGEAHEAHVRRVERMAANGFTRDQGRDFAAEIDAAERELAAFDAAHLEVAASAAAEKAGAVARFLAAD